jgi:hypothetical protein
VLRASCQHMHMYMSMSMCMYMLQQSKGRTHHASHAMHRTAAGARLLRILRAVSSIRSSIGAHNPVNESKIGFCPIFCL